MEERSFDELAKGLAEQTITRGRALKLAGATLLGAVGLVGLPSAAEAKKKKKKRKKKHHHHPQPRMCTASDAAACASCGTSPKTGNSCSCVPSNLGKPACIDTVKGDFRSCTSDTDCLPGSLCIEEFTCGKPPGTFSCAFPCGT